METDVEGDSSNHLAVNKTKEAVTSGSGVSMEIDKSAKLHYSENVEVNSSSITSINSQLGAERMSHDSFAEAHFEKMDAVRSNNIGNGQEFMSLESEIDVENRARLQSMSPDEIAQAHPEIMEKMNPTLLNLLKKRGEKKLKQQKCSSSVSASNIAEPHNAVNVSRDPIRYKLLGVTLLHKVVKTLVAFRGMLGARG